MTNHAYIALGTNLGERLHYLHRAVLLLDNHPHIEVEQLSSIYETDPVGVVDQPDFLNMVSCVSTSLSPHDLLTVTSGIETKLGRERSVRWGPRTIDLDILLYDQVNLKTDVLEIPHPRMFERAFVLIPLAEINPRLHIPESNIPLRDIIQQIPDKEGVRLWKQNCGEEKFALFES
jgi:2-amino-4-hydroxy-6-hydroxymethyldihydropteridine diphosphokinase